MAAASIEVGAARDLPLCEQVAKLVGERLMPDADLLKTVQWKPVELKGQGPKRSRCSSLEQAIVDLNNDGRQDLVVKTSFCMKGAPSESFYVFPEDNPVLQQATWQDMSPLLATQDKFERTGGTYPLTALPMEKGSTASALTTMFTIHPFIFDGVAYVSLTDSRHEWMVIAKYVGGERFEDECYLRVGKF